jgi:hypothetical protein
MNSIGAVSVGFSPLLLLALLVAVVVLGISVVKLMKVLWLMLG